jgi:hypothetical protein
MVDYLGVRRGAFRPRGFLVEAAFKATASTARRIASARFTATVAKPTLADHVHRNL